MVKVPEVSVSLHVQADSSGDFTRLLLCLFRSPPLLTFLCARSILQLHIVNETQGCSSRFHEAPVRTDHILAYYTCQRSYR